MGFFDWTSLNKRVHYFDTTDDNDNRLVGPDTDFARMLARLEGTRYAILSRTVLTPDDIEDESDGTADLAIIERPSVPQLPEWRKQSLEILNGASADQSDYYGTFEVFDGYQTNVETYHLVINGMSRAKLRVIESHAHINPNGHY